MLWAPALARVTDQSFRYTVDKTTREVLFLPLPSELRQEVKPLVDVTVDRMAKAAGSLLTLVLIQPWGFGLQWYQLSFVSLVLALGVVRHGPHARSANTSPRSAAASNSASSSPSRCG